MVILTHSLTRTRTHSLSTMASYTQLQYERVLTIDLSVRLSVFDGATGRLLTHTKLPHVSYAMASSPTHRHVAISTCKAAVIIDSESLVVVASLPASYNTRSVAFSHDGKFLAFGGVNGALTLYDAISAKYTFISSVTESTQAVSCVHFSASSSRLLAHTRAAVTLWSLALNTITKLKQFVIDTYSAVFLSDATFATGTINKRLCLWDIDSGVCTQSADHVGVVTLLTLSPSWGTIAARSSDNTVKLLDSRSFLLIKMLTYPSRKALHSIAFVNENTILIGCEASEVMMVNIRSGATVLTLPKHSRTRGIVSVRSCLRIYDF